MEMVIDYAVLKGSHDEIIIKEVTIAADGVIQSTVLSPYNRVLSEKSISSEIGLHWDDGDIPYTRVANVLDEAAAGYAHLYDYGTAKCSFLSELINRQFLNLEHFDCPQPRNLNILAAFCVISSLRTLRQSVCVLPLQMAYVPFPLKNPT